MARHDWNLARKLAADLDSGLGVGYVSIGTTPRAYAEAGVKGICEIYLPLSDVRTLLGNRTRPSVEQAAALLDALRSPVAIVRSRAAYSDLRIIFDPFDGKGPLWSFDMKLGEKMRVSASPSSGDPSRQRIPDTGTPSRQPRRERIAGHRTADAKVSKTVKESKNICIESIKLNNSMAFLKDLAFQARSVDGKVPQTIFYLRPGSGGEGYALRERGYISRIERNLAAREEPIAIPGWIKKNLEDNLGRFERRGRLRSMFASLDEREEVAAKASSGLSQEPSRAAGIAAGSFRDAAGLDAIVEELRSEVPLQSPFLDSEGRYEKRFMSVTKSGLTKTDYDRVVGETKACFGIIAARIPTDWEVLCYLCGEGKNRLVDLYGPRAVGRFSAYFSDHLQVPPESVRAVLGTGASSSVVREKVGALLGRKVDFPPPGRLLAEDTKRHLDRCRDLEGFLVDLGRHGGAYLSRVSGERNVVIPDVFVQKNWPGTQPSPWGWRLSGFARGSAGEDRMVLSPVGRGDDVVMEGRLSRLLPKAVAEEFHKDVMDLRRQHRDVPAEVLWDHARGYSTPEQAVAVAAAAGGNPAVRASYDVLRRLAVADRRVSATVTFDGTGVDVAVVVGRVGGVMPDGAAVAVTGTKKGESQRLSENAAQDLSCKKASPPELARGAALGTENRLDI